jgi:hypothetical protein
VVDAGLGSNFFDQEIIRLAMRHPAPPAPRPKGPAPVAAPLEPSP